MPLALFQPSSCISLPTKANEKQLSHIEFIVHKYNTRVKPRDRRRILIISCFSEFGCETVGCMYCIPRILQRSPGFYVIIMGWYGRAFLYRHLADEFWELPERYMWLKDYVYAFHSLSRNLVQLEKAANCAGQVLPSAALGSYVIGNYCRTCGKYWNEWRYQIEACPVCHSTVIVNSIFSDVDGYKKSVVRLPRPSKQVMVWWKS